MADDTELERLIHVTDGRIETTRAKLADLENERAGYASRLNGTAPTEDPAAVESPAPESAEDDFDVTL